MEFKFIVAVPPEATKPPVALRCSRLLSDHIWNTVGDYKGIHMKHGRRIDSETYEFTWDMGRYTDPHFLTEPDWIQSCVALADPDASPEPEAAAEAAAEADADADPAPTTAAEARSIIAAVGRTVSPNDDAPPF